VFSAKVSEIHYVCIMRFGVLGLLVWWCALNAHGQSYFLNGDAAYLGNDCYMVTANNDWQNGTVWYSDQLNLTEDFSIEFDMYFGTSDANGADGMAFVLQTVGPNAIGASGGGMGFQGFNPSFGIEFDTFVNNDANDPAYDHVAFLRNGNIFHNSVDNLAGPVAATVGQTNIEDGQSHQVKITWDATAQMVSLYVDCQLRLTDNINLVNSIFQGNTLVYWGFTGATGGFFNEQRVCLDIIVNNAPNSYSVCAGQAVELAANGSLAGSVLWSPADELDDPTSFHPTAYPMQSTTYCYTYTDFCGESTVSCVEVEVVDPPAIVLPQDWVFCEGESFALAAVVTGASDVLWSSSGGEFLSDVDVAEVVVASGGEYTIEASSALADCSASASTMVNVLPLPSYTPSPYTICPNDQLQLEVPLIYDVLQWWNESNEHSVTVDAGGIYTVEIAQEGCTELVVFEVIEWFVPALELGPNVDFCYQDEPFVLDAGTTVLWNDGTQASSIAVAESGVYQAIWTDGNCLLSDEVVVQITPMPQIQLSGPDGFCAGDQVELQCSHAGIWNDGSFGPSLLVDTEGQYQISVTDGPCQTTGIVQLALWDLPSLELGPDRVVCDDQPTVLLAGDSDASLQYIWSTGELDPTIEVDQTGWYTCTKSNLCGAVQDSIYVELMDCQSELFIPNSFTPNADGINDVWQVVGLNVSDVRIQVYDRWGILVFESSGTDRVWMGDHQGGTHYVPSDVYHFVIRFVDIQGDHLKKMGTVSVIR
jgi:gliding motility-associated-like protein